MTASDADKAAIDRDFEINLRDHTLADLYNRAPPTVSAKLRSPEFAEAWGHALSEIQPKLHSKELRIRAQAYRNESAKLRRNEAAGPVKPTLRSQIKEVLGIDYVDGTSVLEMQILLQVEAVKLLRDIARRNS